MGKNDISSIAPATAAMALLLAAYAYDDTLSIDLYGTRDGDEISVEKITVAGTQNEITTLFSGKQLENLGHYLELKDSAIEAHQTWAWRFQCEAQRY